MNHTAKYAAVTGLLFAGVCGLLALGFSVAGEGFARNPSAAAPVVETDALKRSPDAHPSSPLLGADPERVARELEARRSWVEVVDAVNMRQGPSSANAVIKVQLAGTKLQVSSREGSWVEVVEPETGGTGWVFEAMSYPSPPPRASRARPRQWR